MESEWTRGVVELGVGDTGATLAARKLSDPTRVITNETTGFTNNAREWYYPPNAEAPYLRALIIKTPGHPHFPYGIPVTPP